MSIVQRGEVKGRSRGLAIGRFLFLSKGLGASSSFSDTILIGSTTFSLPLTDIAREESELCCLCKRQGQEI